jgi:hypothetical protein
MHMDSAGRMERGAVLPLLLFHTHTRTLIVTFSAGSEYPVIVTFSAGSEYPDPWLTGMSFTAEFRCCTRCGEETCRMQRQDKLQSGVWRGLKIKISLRWSW